MGRLSISEDQALFFRARRCHLAGTPAADARGACRASVGAQAQQVGPALWGIAQRVQGTPTAKDLLDLLLSEGRVLVRVWGQRDTLHVFDAASQWMDMVAARVEWAPGGRRGEMPPQAAVNKARTALHNAQGPITRRDIFDLVPPAYLQEVAERTGPGDAAKRFAAGRLLWKLTLQGESCVAGKFGAEQAYASRIHGYPDLDWQPSDPHDACLRLTDAYLAAYGPATVQDVAHFFGARVGTTRTWIADMASQLTPVTCGPRDDLWIRTADSSALRVAAPKTKQAWPLRLLPMWDGLLMGHKDKSWTVPDQAERSLVWRKSAIVSATVLEKGRIVATWTHKASTSRLTVTVQPLSRWQTSYTAAVHRAAAAFATHLGLADVIVEVA